MDSIIHYAQLEKKVILVSLNIEIGGPRCDIIQLSALFINQNQLEIGKFNSYCKPSAGDVFFPQVCECHVISPRVDPLLVGTPLVSTFWKDFCKKVTELSLQNKNKGYIGVLVAWNNKTCDMEWIYKLINLISDCNMP